MQDEQQQAMAMIKAVYDDGFAEIHDRKYVFLKMQHQDRKKIFAFFSSVREKINNQDFSFIDSEGFEKVESIIYNYVSFNDSILSRIDNHWDKYPMDYLLLISTALAVISYPFLAASLTN